MKEGHAYVTIGQSAFVQGYLPVALLVNAIKGGKKLGAGFYNAGSSRSSPPTASTWATG